MKNVLITGGSKGIGEAAVRLFCEKGCRVAFTYKSSATNAEKIAKETGALALFCDLENEDDIISATKSAKKYFGDDAVDVLINNAAIGDIKLFSDITRKDWQRMLDICLTAPYVFIREMLDDMIHKKSGTIINVSSMWGVCGASCEVHYSAAKAGLIGMTKALAKELGPSGITVNAIAPGLIDTAMNSSLSDEDKRAIIDEIPLMRMGRAEEIAALMYFMSSDEASYITGQVIGPNGGMVI